MAAEIFHSLGKALKKRGLSISVGDEGGYAPALSSDEEVLDTIVQAAKQVGYENVTDFRLALDVASTEFYVDGKYELHKIGKTMTADELTKYYQEIGIKYNILSFEDAFAEDDWDAHTKFAAMAEPVH